MSVPGQEVLIVEKSLLAEDVLQQLLTSLEADYSLDAFTARQRLWGSGLSLLARGADQRLQGLADLLTRHGVTHWLLQPTAPKFAPKKVSALRISSDAVTFACSTAEVILARGDSVLAVLADLSGNVAEKAIKRLLLHQAYRGTTADAGFDTDELQLAILRNRPVLDLYLLTDTYTVRDAVRFFPGRFNPAGLGERGSHSATGNLRAVMELVRSYAAEWYLRTDFGLANLPGCQLAKGDNRSASEKANLASLTRFGWLMSDLLAASPPHRADVGIPPELSLTGVGLPVLEQVRTAEPVAVRTERAVGVPVLPPPPDTENAPKGRGWRKNQPYLALAPIALFLLGVGMQQPALRTVFLRYGLDYGLVPALLSLLLVWRGFHALRLKRQVENMPTSKVRSLAMGLVELHGRAERRYALVSPMSHTPCVWFRLSKFRNDENGIRRFLASSDSGPVSFFLDDGTGRALVLPEGAKICADTNHEGPPSGGLLFANQRTDDDEHWVEEVIPEGTWLYVLGFARPRRQAPTSLKERLVERLRHLKSSAAMQRFDGDDDGRLSEEEWTAARQVIEQDILAESLDSEQDPRQQREKTAIGRPPQRGLPFIIAEAASELQVAGRYGRRAFLLLSVAVGLGVWAVFTWLERYLF